MLNEIKGLGSARIQSLIDGGITKPLDLIMSLPVSYEDSTVVVPLRELRAGDRRAFEGCVAEIKSYGYGKTTRVHMLLESGVARLLCVWFGSPYVKSTYHENDRVTFFGRVSRSPCGRLTCVHPKKVDERCVLPVYKNIDGLPQKVRRDAIRQAFGLCEIASPLPESALVSMSRVVPPIRSLRDAYHAAHFPKDMASVTAALDYIALESLVREFRVSIERKQIKSELEYNVRSDEELLARFWGSLPFEPTNAQLNAAHDIMSDFESGDDRVRLINGDVGSGKTAVAFAAIYAAAAQGFQCAMMAPTESLANQHYANALKTLEPLGLTCVLLSGGAKNRAKLLDSIARGEVSVVIGTHAIISKDVAFRNLALAIIDEQHLFGVRQRETLATRGARIVAMSATPIPRTTAMALRGDMNVSIIDETPRGRSSVTTRFVPHNKVEGMYGFIRAEVEKGRQAYIVCPHADISRDEDCASAAWVLEELRKRELRELRVGLAHGKMNAKLRRETLEAFYRGDIDVLVATTVIEVGIDCRNASVMVIMNAERFGLAQLHQLRGRVGRGEAASWCFLLGEPSDRLRAFTKIHDGFEIAMLDLETRGEGDAQGVRQHGAVSRMSETSPVIVEAAVRIAEEGWLSPNTSYPPLENINK